MSVLSLIFVSLSLAIEKVGHHFFVCVTVIFFLVKKYLHCFRTVRWLGLAGWSDVAWVGLKGGLAAFVWTHTPLPPIYVP